ncbi:Abi-alpha family protein [Paenibacillus sp. GCM10027626]|uniref:Abi-alpha family protein n=1 Tax=Paenibacillus sp. GCM10027626 TaxID=3273411 RepID=UPI003624F37D
MSEDKSLDLLGVKPVADALKTVTEKSMTGIGALLSRICLPAAEELGLYFQDKVKQFRSRNTARIVEKTDKLLNIEDDEFKLKALPRLVHEILENGSWCDDETLQDMWAGLLASSCTLDGKDDSNLLFIDILSKLTIVQVKIINYSCLNAQSTSLFEPLDEILVNLEDLTEITGVKDRYRLDRELDHLRSIGFFAIDGGFFTEKTVLTANITPTSLCLHFFMQCNGGSMPV